jgi:glycosyltransferase involved in cell wall biosynthesis
MELKPIGRPGKVFVAGLDPDVSIVMPCLNEVQSLPHCIANARDALALIEQRYGLSGEVVIADNGSTDGSQALAESLGARVVSVPARGYGAALIGGFGGAYGRYLIMGDADGSYDFTDGVAMIGRLMDGADLCMGSRFAGGIAPGAMPWKNRYIGNPVLTGILNLLFRSGIKDAHCGLRALTKDAFLALGLRGSGMEFASEMVIKASLKRLRIDEVPAKLQPDLRDRPPHLRPWRDGWRHLRYLLMLSPSWVFGFPAGLAMGFGLGILCASILYSFGLLGGTPPFGAGWAIIAGFLLTCGHLSAIMALATHLHGVRAGYRTMRPVLQRFGHWLTLETTLIVGGILVLGSFLMIAGIGVYWTSRGLVALPSTLPLVGAVAMGAIGMQTILGGFLMAIMAGNEANLAPRVRG